MSSASLLSKPVSDVDRIQTIKSVEAPLEVDYILVFKKVWIEALVTFCSFGLTFMLYPSIIF